MNPVLMEVQKRIDVEGLRLKEAARQIGISLNSLQLHLEGSYARSDSLAKYRNWLEGKAIKTPRELPLERRQNYQHLGGPSERLADLRLFDKPPPKLDHPYLVVDLFSGCGGMSLGFDRFQSHTAFRTVLAIDSEEPMVRVYNDNNNRWGKSAGSKICRQLDLTEFLSETEVLAFYLDHFAQVYSDQKLLKELAALPGTGLKAFKGWIASLDQSFQVELETLRRKDSFRKDYGLVGKTVLNQTAVKGFHVALRLPTTYLQSPIIHPLIWSDGLRDEGNPEDLQKLTFAPSFREIHSIVKARLQALWDAEAIKLDEKTSGNGRNQLASSAVKIRSFVDFVSTESMAEIREAWLRWRALRDSLRVWFFEDRKDTAAAIRASYSNERQVSVLLGGPPCQGFSRIGRGKIRSLRDNKVHVHYDPESGDIRNRLLEKYVLFVSALAPKVFLFENVEHFRAKVKTREGTFLATEILSEAIADISGEHLSYNLHNQLIRSSLHLVPQTRVRFFMVGMRSDVATESPTVDAPIWCLALQEREEIPARVALEGLPEPFTVEIPPGNGLGGTLSRLVETTLRDSNLHSAASEYIRWIRQDLSDGSKTSEHPRVDAHFARASRSDDRDLFALFGPGKRWMDYRCDSSPTLKQLLDVVENLKKTKALLKRMSPSDSTGKLNGLLAKFDDDALRSLSETLNGSLSLRLLMEKIQPLSGELSHHLISPNYLAKRDGNHGDWLSRLDAERPSKTLVSHMSKDTYAYIHPYSPRSISVREAARIQSFPDWFSFGSLGMVDAFRVIGNAVPPLLSYQLAGRVAQILWASECQERTKLHLGRKKT